MIAYLLKRLGMAVLVVLLLMVFLSVIVHLIPGDPVRTIMGPRASEELSADRSRRDGARRSRCPCRCTTSSRTPRRATSAQDFVSHLSVTTLIGEALPHTLILAAAGLGLAAIIGIPLGVFASTRPNSMGDRMAGIVSISLHHRAGVRRRPLPPAPLRGRARLVSGRSGWASSPIRSTT